MYNYEKNRDQVVKDLDRVIRLIHMKADEIPEEEKAQMVKETVEHFNTCVSPGWINYRKCVSSETEGSAVLEWEDGGSYFRGLYENEKFLDAMGGFGIYVAGHSEDLIIDTVKAQLDRQGLLCLDHVHDFWLTVAGGENAEATQAVQELFTP